MKTFFGITIALVVFQFAESVSEANYWLFSGESIGSVRGRVNVFSRQLNFVRISRVMETYAVDLSVFCPEL